MNQKKKDGKTELPPREFPGRNGVSPIPEVPKIPDPPVPNRAWTEMRMGYDIDDLSEEERRDLYIGRDQIL